MYNLNIVDVDQTMFIYSSTRRDKEEVVGEVAIHRDLNAQPLPKPTYQRSLKIN
jgi:hypothetical protein